MGDLFVQPIIGDADDAHAARREIIENLLRGRRT
jgi:hypothetical protein